MSVSHNTFRSVSRSPEPAPVSTGAVSGTKNPGRASQFVLSSKITNAPQTTFLAQKVNTLKANKVAHQAQIADPRLTARKAKTLPTQVTVANRTGSTDRPSTFFNQDGITTMTAKMPPNKDYLRSHGLTSPGHAKTQAAASLAYRLFR